MLKKMKVDDTHWYRASILIIALVDKNAVDDTMQTTSLEERSMASQVWSDSMVDLLTHASMMAGPFLDKQAVSLLLCSSCLQQHTCLLKTPILSPCSPRHHYGRN